MEHGRVWYHSKAIIQINKLIPDQVVLSCIGLPDTTTYCTCLNIDQVYATPRLILDFAWIIGSTQEEFGVHSSALEVLIWMLKWQL